MRISASRHCAEYVVLSLVLLALQTAGAIAQTIPYKQYTDKDGIANSLIFRLCQDEQGYIWITTNYGLNRFDGSKLVTYDVAHERNTMLAICSDRKGRIWTAGVYQGLFCIENDSLVPFAPRSGRIPEGLVQLAADAQDRIWMLDKYHRAGYLKDSIYRPFRLGGFPEQPEIYQVFITAGKRTLLATSSGLVEVDKNGKTQRAFAGRLTEVPLYSIAEDRDGHLFAGAEGRIYILKDGLLDSVNTRKHEPVLNMRSSRPGSVWYTTPRAGLFLSSDRADKDYARYLALDRVFINDLYTTRDGILLLGTYGKGLYVINRHNLISYDISAGLPSNMISCLAQDSAGTVYIGGFNNIATYSKGRFSTLSDIKIRSDEDFKSLLLYNGDLWVATPYHIFRYNLKSRRLERHFPGGTRLIRSGDGHIISCAYSYIEQFSPSSDISLQRDTIFRWLKGYQTNDICKDASGGYWFATSNGLFRTQGDSVTQLTRGYCTKATAYDGKVWVTGEHGLLSADRQNGVRYYLTETHQPIPSSYTLALLGNRFLIGTLRGLYQYRNGAATGVRIGNVLPESQINAIQPSSRDQLWLGTTAGLYQWDLSSERSSSEPPKIILRNIQNGQTNVPLTEGRYEIPYRHETISLNYDLIDFNMPDAAVFEYRILGIDSNWNITDSRTIHLTSLGHGSHRIQLRAHYKGSQTTSDTITAMLVVATPIWLKGWAILLAASLCIALTGGLLFWYNIRLRERERRKTLRYVRLLQLKQQAANTLLNSHFIFNSLNSIQNFINKADPTSANRYLSKFARLIRKAMENATDLNVSLARELEMIELYLSLESIRLSGKLAYSIDVGEGIDKDSIMVPSMLIQPHLENAVWHGIGSKTGQGQISVAIAKRAGGFLEITIEDNGGGMKEPRSARSIEHRPMGINLTRQRIEIIEKLTGKRPEFKVETLRDRYQNSLGTRVTLRLPIKEHLRNPARRGN